jgi:hypothetical protein
MWRSESLKTVYWDSMDVIRIQMRLAMLMVLVIITAAAPPVMAVSSDDARFIASLAGTEGGRPVDRERLARLFFGVASTLDSSKNSVQRLQALLPSRDEPNGSTTDYAANQYEDYVRLVKQFQQSVNDLLDDPDSGLRLYRVLMDGQRTCWELYMYYNLVDTYGVSGADMLTALTSPEVCETFRAVAHKPRVINLVAVDLAGQQEQGRELTILREELLELEQLLHDLRLIDEDVP